MKTLLKKTAFLTAAFLLLAAALAPAGDDRFNPGEPRSAEKMVVDALVVRPLGILGTAAGTLVFVVSLPFSALGGNTDAAFQKLVADPAAYTFTRPLGDL